MAITVFWACAQKEWMRAQEPESVSKIFYKKGIHDPKNMFTSLNYCPAFNKNLNNIYAVKSIYDYNFYITNGELKSDLYDQQFFDEHVLIRSMEKKFFSFFNSYVFFTETESLEMTAYEFPFFEENEITKRCIPIPGTYDIGKWIRPLEFPFLLKNEFDTFSVENKDILYYIKFHTKEKIIFKQFIVEEKIRSYFSDAEKQSLFIKNTYGNLQEFYNNFKHKKNVLKEIKNNLI